MKHFRCELCTEAERYFYLFFFYFPRKQPMKIIKRFVLESARCEDFSNFVFLPQRVLFIFEKTIFTDTVSCISFWIVMNTI